MHVLMEMLHMRMSPCQKALYVNILNENVVMLYRNLGICAVYLTMRVE